MGKVLVTTAMSLDGYMAGPDHDMDWVFEHAGDVPAEVTQQLIDATGSILAGRGSYDVGRRSARSETQKPFGGRWSGPQLVLTHHPPDDEEDPSITFISTDIRSAVDAARDAAGEKDVLVFGGDIGRQALAAGLVDEILVFLLPVVLGGGVRLFGAGGMGKTDLEAVEITREGAVANLRYAVAR